MSIAARMTRAPRPYDPARGREAVAVLDLPAGPEADLIAGAAGCSPYLAGSIAREAEWLGAALNDPEAACDAEIAGLADLPLASLATALRVAKRRVALVAGLADLAGVWPLEEVTGRLSDFADAACEVASARAIEASAARGKLPDAPGFVIVAMGKGGARELNYSSDIDLICLFDEERHGSDAGEVRAELVRVTRRVTQLLSEVTPDGYVFRTDLRLRPDASVTPVCLAMGMAEAYYESVGRTWERAAWIKARPAAGDIAAGDAFAERLRPFVWRRHLDFAAIEDAHDMRLRIRAHKGFHDVSGLEGHDLKLGRGGIREIEFFVQTRQLIAGGRDPSLRVRGTVAGLDRLTAAGWVGADTARDLTTHYRAHREMEHRLQMIGDRQTHALPTDADGFDRLAAFMATDTATLRAEVAARIDAVHRLTDGFFAPDAPDAPDAPGGAAHAVPPVIDEDIVSRWPTYPALRSDRARTTFRRLRPGLMSRLARAARPGEALANFDRFLAGLPAGVQLFALFDANPPLLDLLVEICAASPALSDHLSRNAGVLDAVIGGDFFADWPGPEALTAALAAVLAKAPDHEARLDAARRWAKEWHFRIGVHHLRGLGDADAAGLRYGDLAQAVLAAIWPVVEADVARRHGPAPGRGAAIVAMGSLGAGRLHSGSDLDLIVIYDPADAEMSDGPRPLSVRAWYARATQTLVTALSAPMAEGRLYEVDMRLRPSGRQGPVATSLGAFASYQRSDAWTWEHLALTRGRVVAGARDVGDAVERLRRDILSEKASGPTVRADIADMRDRIAAAWGEVAAWEAKLGQGRLQDAELAAQGAALLAGSTAQDVAGQLSAGVAAGAVTRHGADAIAAAATTFRRLRIAQSLAGGAAAPDTLGEGARDFVLAQMDARDVGALERILTDVAARAATAIDDMLEGPR